MNLPIGDIAKLVDKTAVINDPSFDYISAVLFDTRLAIKPMESLFFAIKGARDGHTFLQEGIKMGIRNFVISEVSYLPILKECNYILVSDVMAVLQRLALEVYKDNRAESVVALTGSYGKTILKEWIYQVVSSTHSIYRSPKSYNSKIGLPISMLQKTAETDLDLFEVGISTPHEMDVSSILLKPFVGILSKMGEAHLHNFNSYQHLIAEKLKLFATCSQIICNSDQKEVYAAIKAAYPTTDITDWGTQSGAIVHVLQWPSKAGSILKVEIDSTPYVFELQAFDRPFVENVLYVITFLKAQFPNTYASFFSKIALLEPLEMRYEVKKGARSCVLINDAYTTDLTTLKMALKLAENRLEDKSLCMVLSDLEVPAGQDSKMYYKAVLDIVEQFPVQKFIGIGPALSNYFKAIQFPTTLFFTNVVEALEDPFWKHLNNEVVLFKGARKYRLEKLFRFASDQLHDAVLSINLAAIGHNLVQLSSQVSSTTKHMVMVKANAYGCGAVEVGRYLQDRKVDYLAVAYEDEGIELRKNGIKTPIMVMNPSEHSLPIYPSYDLEPEIYHQDLLHQLLEIKANWRIHIKLNTGMNRLGFSGSELKLLKQFLKENKHIKVASIFSHLAVSDDPSQEVFTRKQFDLFNGMSSELIQVLGYRPLLHILNSAGIFRFPEAELDMVRAGIAVYGVTPTSKPLGLQTVISLKAKVSQIISIDKGDTVGYGRSFVATKKMKIATISIGYADGLNRKLSNGAWAVEIGGKLAPIVGRVCMDMTMVDVSHIASVYRGQVVEILNENNNLGKMAAVLETIPYEILVGISKRIKRTYFLE